MEQNCTVDEVPGGVPVKMWTRGVPVEDEARKQLANAARLPVVFKHIAAMPDVHLGIGATVGSVISKPFESHVEAVNCHHNYVQQERHFGEDVFVTRKGAVSARKGQLGIIPGSMGARSFIVRGADGASESPPPDGTSNAFRRQLHFLPRS